MIPKIIHYSWFSNEPFPEDVQRYIDTWHKIMPDYEYVLWDGKKLAELNNEFCNEAVKARKWAYAADYLRTYVLYKYGGIWLDTDIEVHKSLDPFLHHRFFIGREAMPFMDSNMDAFPHNCVTAHIFGTEPGHPFLKDCLEVYKNRHFIRCDNEILPMRLKYDMLFLPELYARVMMKYGYKWQTNYNHIQEIDEGIVVYPHYYFDAPRYDSMDKVYTIHCQRGGWLDKAKDLKAQEKALHPKHRKWWWIIIEKIIYNLNRFLIKTLKMKIVRVGNGKSAWECDW